MRVVAITLAILTVGTSPGWATTTPTAPSHDALQSALQRFNEDAVFPLPALSDADWKALHKGEVVRTIDHPGQSVNAPKRATALLLTQSNRNQVWVACQDTHFSQNANVTDILVGSSPETGDHWYGFLDLPRPFHDRHWVVGVRNNHEMARRQPDGGWEHSWQTIEDPGQAAWPYVARGAAKGVSIKQYQEAVWTPNNSGAWLAIAIDEGHTVLGYHAQATLGGYIPETLLLTWAKAQLDDMLLEMAERATQIPTHYTSEHAPLKGGDGREIPRW